ncbi:hypothetical protein FRC08_017506 [Ceratobasidium sp. 394]|nr:hypothetical protein FRC08_017506 [Ceratobasidium sp. 394]
MSGLATQLSEEEPRIECARAVLPSPDGVINLASMRLLGLTWTMGYRLHVWMIVDKNGAAGHSGPDTDVWYGGRLWGG